MEKINCYIKYIFFFALSFKIYFFYSYSLNFFKMNFVSEIFFNRHHLLRFFRILQMLINVFLYKFAIFSNSQESVSNNMIKNINSIDPSILWIISLYIFLLVSTVIFNAFIWISCSLSHNDFNYCTITPNTQCLLIIFLNFHLKELI